MDYVEEKELYPDLRIIDCGAEPEVFVDGKKVLMFSSNNYLGLATHPRMKKVRDANFESFRDFLDIFESDILFGTLNHADISPVNTCATSQFFLR